MREMKDSGIKWMGKIPATWKVEKVKHGFVRKKEEAHQENPVVLSLARAGVKERDISNNEGQIAESYYNYNPVDIDDLLINPMDLYSGANCSISKIKGVISPAYVNLRYLKGHNPNYYDYYFKIQYWLMAFFAHGKGVSFENRWTLNAETLMNYPIITPSGEEQNKIVNYLDTKCSQIDSIIEKQQAIIEKLKEYKLSVITEAVTKGLKKDTFVLDFVNTAEDIKNSFEPFYEETVLLEETDPNVIYDMKNTLDEFRVYQTSEVMKFADIFYSKDEQKPGDLGKLQGVLNPAVDRFKALEIERQDIFKSTLARFNRIYSYITQVCRLFDKDIHKFSVYAKFLYTILPKTHLVDKVNIDDKVLLEYYKLEKDFEGPIELEGTEGGYVPVSGEAGHREPQKDPLTVIIDKINDRFGTNFTEIDKVLLQIENDYALQEKWQNYADNNDRLTFKLLYNKSFPTIAAERYEQDDLFFKMLFENSEMMQQVMDMSGNALYERLRRKKIMDPSSGVMDEATPEMYVEDVYAKLN